MRGALLKVGVVLALGLIGPSAAAAQDPDLAGEWHLDSIAGGTTADTSGHGYTGHVRGAPTPVADGRFAGGLEFPTKGSAIDAGNFADLQPANVSVLAWVRSPTIVPRVKNIVAQGGQSFCSYASYALYTGGSSPSTPQGVQFYVHTSTGNYVTPAAPNTIWDGHWHAVLGTYDGATVRLYVDGTEIGHAPGNGEIGYGLDTSNSLWIGDFAAADNSTGRGCTEQTQFSGDIDEVRIWKRALTSTEAAFVSSSTATTPPELPIQGPPPPPPANPPQNTSVPSISQLGTAGGPTGTHFCNSGTWKNLPSPPGFTYRWIATENGQAVPVGQGQTFTPTSAVWGFPIACEVTVQGPTAPVTATSNAVFFTSAGLNKLPAAYGDVRVKGIDVFQIVQPNSEAVAYWPNGSFFHQPCSGGTPSSYFEVGSTFQTFCIVNQNDPQHAMQQTNYDGVTLDSDKRTTAIVYVNTVNVSPGDPDLPITVELSATRNGQSLGDPLVASAPHPIQPSDSPTVTAEERTNLANQVQFKLPSAWTAAGHLQLTAHVVFPKSDFGPSYGAFQCPTPNDPPGNSTVLAAYPKPNCDIDDTYTLDNVPFEQFIAPQFRSVQLLTSGQTGFRPTPDQVMAASEYLYPGGSRFSFGSYAPSSIDIDAASKVTVDSKGNCVDTAGNKTGGTASGGQATRVCRWYSIDAVMSQWVANNPARTRICRSILCNTYRRNYDAVLAVSNYDSGGGILGCSAGSFCPEPGVQHPVGNDITKVSVSGPSPANTGWLIVNTTVHPVQGSAHELGHWLTLPHAGTGCNNAAINEMWPGDNTGRLQSARFNVTRLNGFRVAPAVDGTPSGRVIYDFMTYCGDFRDRRPSTAAARTTSPAAYPGNTWLSARNWQRVAAALDAFAVRMRLKLQTFPGGGRLAHSARQTSAAFAVGVAGPSSGAITRVGPTNGPDPVPSDAGSPYRLRSLGAGREGAARRRSPHPASGRDPYDRRGRRLRRAGCAERIGRRARVGRPGAGAQGSLPTAACQVAAFPARDPSPSRAEAGLAVAWLRP